MSEVSHIVELAEAFQQFDDCINHYEVFGFDGHRQREYENLIFWESHAEAEQNAINCS